MKTKLSSKVWSLLLSSAILSTAAMTCYGTASAATSEDISADSVQCEAMSSAGSISYAFSGSSKDKAGYAEGKITLTANTAGTYRLYWANDTKALDGYYPIEYPTNINDPKDEGVTLKAGGSYSVSMGYHTAIPAGATKIIATTGSLNTADAAAVYDIPSGKRLSAKSGSLLYKFTTFSDVHIDKGSGYYCNAESNLKKGFSYSEKNGADYVIVSGDCVTNDSGPTKEWEAYANILSKSSFCNPVWESDGNHDMRTNGEEDLKAFVKGSGTDGSSSGKTYFYRVEEKTGDLFIFMALEKSSAPNKVDEFTDTQIAWATDLIEKNYKNKNIFLIQHSPINGFGAGDNMSNPYYGGMLSQSHSSTKKFKALLQKYPNIIFLSGHTHEDFFMDYNYSDENGTAAHMIHTPSLAGSTMPKKDKHDLERNDGKGFRSQAYLTEVYQNEMVFYGADTREGLKYPRYSYIMEGSRTSSSPTNAEPSPLPLEYVDVNITAELAKVSAILAGYDRYASYDAYQSLKKLYYCYKDETTADKSIMDEFEARIKALSKYTGTIDISMIRDTYYFVNTNGWSNVYAYAWDDSDRNASWPGVKLQKTGTDSDGKDVYKVSFSRVGEYKYIIFSNGSSSRQTVNISLRSSKYNAFSLNGTDNGKYKVKNFNLNADGDVTVNKNWAMLYYVSDEHGWSDIDTYLVPEGSVYKLTYRQTNDKNFSFSLYDTSSKKYYSLSESVKHTFEKGKSYTHTLEKMSSRGKSITFSGLDENSYLDITFDPSTKQVTINCTAETPAQPLTNTSTISSDSVKAGDSVTVKGSSEGGAGGTAYGIFYKKTADEEWMTGRDFSNESTFALKLKYTGKYDIRVVARDAVGAEDAKTFTVTSFGELKLTATVTPAIGLNGSFTTTAKATGGLGSYEYAVYYKHSTDTNWMTAQSFKANSSIKTKPTRTGTYDVCVKVRDSRKVVVKKYFTVKVTKPENTSQISATKINLGSTVKITCSATGGSGSYQYSVLFKGADDTKWSTKQNYGSNSIVSFKPQRKTTYTVRARIKDSLGNETRKDFTLTVS